MSSRMPVEVTVGIEDLPVQLKRALAADADARDMSLSEVVVEILSGEFGVAWTKREQRPRKLAISDSPNVTIRMPLQLRDKIKQRSIRRPMRNVILDVLSTHYGLTPPPARRQGRPRSRVG